MTTYTDRTDAHLLRASRRDPQAFEEVCRRHSAGLANYLSAQLRDDNLARELLAETLSEAWFARRRFGDPGDGSARAWLYGIARNLAKRVHRDRAIETRARARLGVSVQSPDAYNELIERLTAEQQLAPLEQHLEQLPDEQREALELRVIDELDYSEIAARLEITAEGARTRVFRALNTLRTQLLRSA